MTEMTNDEIRLKIAELKGWTIIDKIAGCHDFSKATLDDGEIKMVTTIGAQPDWPAKIEDAWKLVEEMQANGDGYDLANVYYYGDESWKQECIIYSPIGGGGKKYTGTADTAPRAICLAYIAWKEAQ